MTQGMEEWGTERVNSHVERTRLFVIYIFRRISYLVQVLHLKRSHNWSFDSTFQGIEAKKVCVSQHVVLELISLRRTFVAISLKEDLGTHAWYLYGSSYFLYGSLPCSKLVTLWVWEILATEPPSRRGDKHPSH